jgi:hypothetical protein
MITKRNRNIKNIFIMLQKGTKSMANLFFIRNIRLSVVYCESKIGHQTGVARFLCGLLMHVLKIIISVHVVYMWKPGQIPTCDLSGQWFWWSCVNKINFCHCVIFLIVKTMVNGQFLYTNIPITFCGLFSIKTNEQRVIQQYILQLAAM